MSIADTDLATVDLTDVELFADGPPHELFARMRAEAPVRWNPMSDGDGFWSVTRAEDIERISKDPETFSSNLSGFMIREDAPLSADVMRMVLLGIDPPEHTKYRMIIQRVFTPATINKSEDAIRSRVNKLLDGICERGTADFVAEVAVPLPLQTIAEILGVPDDDCEKLFEWTNRIERAVGTASDDGMAAFGEMGMYLAGLVNERKENPTSDLISQLIVAEVDGERLDDLQLTAFFALLMFAGNDTTRNTASGGLLGLLQEPSEVQKLRDDPAMIPSGVEEMIRWVSAVVHFRRTATKDTEIGGVPIKRGDKVVMWYPSGSRDEARVEEPMRFTIDRDGASHQAFGGGGRHFCLGAGLARLQLRILLEELLRRMPDIQIDGSPVHGRSNWVNGITALPVKFTPSSPQG